MLPRSCKRIIALFFSSHNKKPHPGSQQPLVHFHSNSGPQSLASKQKQFSATGFTSSVVPEIENTSPGVRNGEEFLSDPDVSRSGLARYSDRRIQNSPRLKLKEAIVSSLFCAQSFSRRTLLEYGEKFETGAEHRLIPISHPAHAFSPLPVHLPDRSVPPQLPAPLLAPR